MIIIKIISVVIDSMLIIISIRNVIIIVICNIIVLIISTEAHKCIKAYSKDL